jgi:hypothetical protein
MKMTNQQLISCYEQLVDMKRNGSIIAYLMAAKIRQWENDNMVRINSILEKMKEIDMEYWQHTAIDGRVEYTMVEGENGKREPILKEGKERQDFEKAYQVLLGEETTMIL